MRINEDYLDQNIEDALDDTESVKDERELKYQFRIVSRGDYSNHLNTEEAFRRSLDLVVSKTPNVLEYKITSIALPTEEKDNSISVTPTFVQHRDSQDFIADFQMDIRKFSTLSSLYRFLSMIHDTVKYKSGDDVDLYLKLDTSTDSSDSVGYIFQWYLLASLVSHGIEGYSRCYDAMNSFRKFAEVLTSIPEECLNNEIYEFLQFWDNKRIFINSLEELTQEILKMKPYDEKRVNSRLDIINESLKRVKHLNINKALSEDGTGAIFYSIYKEDASRAFTQYGRREPFRPAWITTWGKECEFCRGSQSFAKEVALSRNKQIDGDGIRTFMIQPGPGSRDSRVVIVFSYGIVVDPDNELTLCGGALILPYKKTLELISKMKK